MHFIGKESVLLAKVSVTAYFFLWNDNKRLRLRS